MILKIERIAQKNITTKKGAAVSLSVLSEGKWYGCFKEDWNRDWKRGDEIEIPDDRIYSNESGGRTYLNIKAPPRGAGGGSGSDGVLAKLDAIHKDVQAIKAFLEREP